MYWDFPSTLTTQVGLLADVIGIATAIGVGVLLKIGLDIRFTLSESLHVQRDEAIGRQLQILGAKSDGSGQSLVSEILLLAENEKHPRGYSEAELADFAKREPRAYSDYLAWVSRLIILFDIVSAVRLWDSADTKAAVSLLLQKHKTALRRERVGGALHLLIKRVEAAYLSD